jgi:hypothetical protein
MLNSVMNLGLTRQHKYQFRENSETLDLSFFKDAVEITDETTCYIWAAKYQNISTILNDLHLGIHRGKKFGGNENNRPVLCELVDGVVRTMDFAILVRKRSPFFECINDVMSHIVEGGIFLPIKNRVLEKAQTQTKFNFPTSEDECLVLGVRNLQTAFYLLMLGYVLAVVCFVTEIVWHRYRAEWIERINTYLCYRQT